MGDKETYLELFGYRLYGAKATSVFLLIIWGLVLLLLSLTGCGAAYHNDRMDNELWAREQTVCLAAECKDESWKRMGWW